LQQPLEPELKRSDASLHLAPGSSDGGRSRMPHALCGRYEKRGSVFQRAVHREGFGRSMIAPTHPSKKPCALDTVRRHEQRLRGRLLLLSPFCFVGQKHSQGTVRQAMHAATDSSDAAAPEFTSVLAKFQPASKGGAHNVACVSVEVAKDQLLHGILELSRIQDGTGFTNGRRRVSMPIGCQTHPRMPNTRRLPRRSTTSNKTMARHEFNPALSNCAATP
jgi:hypothetical protein